MGFFRAIFLFSVGNISRWSALFVNSFVMFSTLHSCLTKYDGFFVSASKALVGSNSSYKVKVIQYFTFEKTAFIPLFNFLLPFANIIIDTMQLKRTT